jgi:hypothetical protein
MLRRLVLLCLVSTWCLVLAGAAAAQSRLPDSVEGSIGMRAGHGGTYVNRGGVAVDGVLAYYLRPTSFGTLLGGVAVGAQSVAPARTLECLLLPDGGCAPNFPAFFSGSALVGVHYGSTRTASARLWAGPTYHQALEGGAALGLLGRLDVATPPWQQMAVVASVRRAVLPSFRGEAVGITSFGVGLRIH